MHTVLAALPLIVAFVLLAMRQSAVRAALAAVACAVVVAVTAFPAPADAVWSMTRSLGPTLVEVLVILLGGVVLSEALTRSGAQNQLAIWIQQCCTDPGRAVLLIVLGVTPFAESVTGFGIGVVVAVPLLRHLGLPATRAAVLGLFGLVIVPWGALAPGTLVASELGGVEFGSLGVRTAALSGPVILVVGAAALVVARGWRRALTYLPDLVVVGGVLWVGVWAANWLIGTPLAGAVGSLAAIAAALSVSWVRDRVSVRIDAATRWALRPYSVLVAGLLVSSLLVHDGDGAEPSYWIASPATWLVITCMVTPAMLGLRGVNLNAAIVAALSRWRPVAAATALFLVLGGVLTATGMSVALASAASDLGISYSALVPVIGGLGGYIAGSNTGANAMFAASQSHAAQALGVSPLQMLATQNVSASLLTMAAPPRIALAAELASSKVPEPDTSETAAMVSDSASDRPATAHHESSPATAANARTITRTVLATDVSIIVVLGVLNVILSWVNG